MAERGGGILQMIRMMLDKASADKTAQEMQDAMGKGTDPKAAAGNMNRLMGMAKRLGAALAAAFAVAKIIQFGRESVAAALDSRKEWGLLTQQIENAGVAFGDVEGQVKAVAQSFIDAGVSGDEAFASSLRTLVAMSGDVTRSLANMNVVADVAAGRQIGLEEAALMVGKAMNGNVTALQKLGIEVPKGADAVAFLAARYRGMAEAIDPAIRAQIALAETWDNFKEAVGEALIASADGESVMGTLKAVVQALTRVVEENKDGIAAMGRIVSWFVRLPGAMILGLFSGLTTIVSAAAKTYWLFAEAASFVGRLFGANTEGIDNHIAGLESWIIKADEASRAADKLARALMNGGAPGAAVGSLNRSGGIGGAVRGAGAGQGGGKAQKPEKRDAIDVEAQSNASRIDVAQRAMEVGHGTDLWKQGMLELITLEEELQNAMNLTGLTLGQRVQMAEELAMVQETLAATARGAKIDFDLLHGTLMALADGGIKGVVRWLGGEAKYRAIYNLAKAIEEYAMGTAAAASLNPATVAKAPLHFKAATMHKMSALKWGMVAGGAALAGGAMGGGGGAGGGSMLAGGSASRDMTNPGVRVTVYVDGIDPTNPRHQERVADTNRQIRERYGEDSAITVRSA